MQALCSLGYSSCSSLLHVQRQETVCRTSRSNRERPSVACTNLRIMWQFWALDHNSFRPTMLWKFLTVARTVLDDKFKNLLEKSRDRQCGEEDNQLLILVSNSLWVRSIVRALSITSESSLVCCSKVSYSQIFGLSYLVPIKKERTATCSYRLTRSSLRCLQYRLELNWPILLLADREMLWGIATRSQ